MNLDQLNNVFDAYKSHYEKIRRTATKDIIDIVLKLGLAGIMLTIILSASQQSDKENNLTDSVPSPETRAKNTTIESNTNPVRKTSSKNIGLTVEAIRIAMSDECPAETPIQRQIIRQQVVSETKRMYHQLLISQFRKYSLSDQECEIAGYMLEGQDYESIAKRVRLATSTIKFHVGNIFTKTGTRSRGQFSQLIHNGLEAKDTIS